MLNFSNLCMAHSRAPTNNKNNKQREDHYAIYILNCATASSISSFVIDSICSWTSILLPFFCPGWSGIGEPWLQLLWGGSRPKQQLGFVHITHSITHDDTDAEYQIVFSHTSLVACLAWIDRPIHCWWACMHNTSYPSQLAIGAKTLVVATIMMCVLRLVIWGSLNLTWLASHAIWRSYSLVPFCRKVFNPNTGESEQHPLCIPSDHGCLTTECCCCGEQDCSEHPAPVEIECEEEMTHASSTMVKMEDMCCFTWLLESLQMSLCIFQQGMGDCWWRACRRLCAFFPTGLGWLILVVAVKVDVLSRPRRQALILRIHTLWAWPWKLKLKVSWNQWYWK